MKKINKLLLFLLIIFSVKLIANGGIGYKGIYINNKGTKTWYKTHDVSWGYGGCGNFQFNSAASFNAQNFGTFGANDVLEISGFAVVGWTDNSDWVSGELQYKVWKQGDVEPGWSTIDVGNYGNCSGASNVVCSSGNDRVVGYDNGNLNIKPTTAGVYNFKVKSLGRMQYNCGSFNANDGTELTATFTVALSTGTISGSPFCTGASVNVPFTAAIAFNAANVFTAQLSDANGSFATPTTIGTLSSTTSGTIPATIPLGIGYGTGYRIRVIASDPSITGSNNGTNLTINGISFANLETSTYSMCPGSNIANGAVTGRIWVQGITTSVGQGSGITVEFGWNNSDTNPKDWTNWTAATYKDDGGAGADDRYTINNFGSALASGTYYYTFRYRHTSCSEWKYGGYNAGFWDGSTNKNGVLTVKKIPTITAQPSTSTQTVCQNQSATAITVSAEGLNLSYQWFKNTTATNSGGVSVQSGPSASYTPITSSPGILYYYVVVTGDCGSATSNVSGSVTVTPVAAATLSSAAGTNNQTVMNDSSPITPITYSVTSASSASVTGLPSGVTGNLSGNTYTISGAPTQVGTFNYTVTFTASCGSNVTVNGTIKVNSYTVEYANIQYPKNPLMVVGDMSFDIYAQVQLTGVTDVPQNNPDLNGIKVWIGYSPVNAAASTDFTSANWVWIPAEFNYGYTSALSYYIASRDEYQVVDFIAKAEAAGHPLIPGTEYFYVSRAQRTGSSEYTYGGIDGTYNNISGGIWNGGTFYSNKIKVTDEIIWDNTYSWKYHDDYNNTYSYDKYPLQAGIQPITPSIKLKTEIQATYDATRPGFNTKKLTVNSGINFTIGSGKSVSVVNEVINNNLTPANFVVQSDANLIQVNESASNVGNITVERKAVLPATQYMYWSSPVEFINGENFKTIYPGTPNALYYNEATSFFGNSTGAYILARGLALKGTAAAGTNFTATFKGKPYNGQAEYTLAYSGPLYGYNLVGNPYPSNIDLMSLYSNNNTKIDSTIQFWDNSKNGQTTQLGTLYTGDSYAKFNAADGTETPATNNTKKPSRYAVVGQGFMVRALSTIGSTDKKLVFKNVMRKSNSGVFFNRNVELPANSGKYWLRMTTPQNNFNTIAITYSEGATNGYEAFDSKQNSAADMFYSTADNEKLAIQGRQYPFVNTDVVSLGSKQLEAGLHKIELVETEGVFGNGQTIYLKDKQTGIITNLTEGGYSFNMEAGENNGRFEIVYEPQSILATGGNVKEELQVYRDASNFVIKSQNKKITSVEVYDASGRLVYNIHSNSTKEIIDATQMNRGMYILKIHQSGEVSTKKILK